MVELSGRDADDPDSPVGDALRLRTANAYAPSAVLFVVSIWIPRPVSYLLWAVAYLHESRVMLAGSARADDQTEDHAVRSAVDPVDAPDAHHFAERFGLFIIILLGEVVVEAGEGAADGHSPSVTTWIGLIAAVTLAVAFWWTYFAAAAEIDMNELKMSGGSPKVARAIFAAGHMVLGHARHLDTDADLAVPAFALLLAAAGVGLLLRQDPPRIADWLAAIGSGMYLTGTRAAGIEASGRRQRLLRTVPVWSPSRSARCTRWSRRRAFCGCSRAGSRPTSWSSA